MQEALRITDDGATFNGLTLAKVYHVYSEARMVDAMLFNGTLLHKVQILASYASSRGGGNVLPIPKYFNSKGQEISMLDRPNPMATARQSESDVWAVVGYLGGYLLNPVVLGFLYPEQCEVLCGWDQIGNSDGSMFLWKHESNTYARMSKAESGQRNDADGNPIETDDPLTPTIEISHPSGLLIKIGSYDTAKNPDEQRTPIVNWDSMNQLRTFNPLNPVTGKPDPAPYVHVYHPSGTYFTVDEEGTVTVYGKKDLGITIEGDVTRTINGNVTEVINGTLNQTVKQKVTQDFQDDFESTVHGDSTETFEKTSEFVYEQDITETYQGKLTQSVAGAWERESDVSIKDTAPLVQHEG